jgi:hypothetical protein
MSTLMVRPHRTLEPSDWADFCIRTLRSRSEGDILFMGALHPDHVVDCGTLYELYVATEKNTGGT